MTVKITIIGLGQVGASFGLALSEHKDKVITVGHDKDHNTEKQAKKNGVVDDTNHNLPSSVDGADMVILALPVNQVRETLEHISKDLKGNAIVVDMSPIKAEVAKWAKEILPENVHFVGLIPETGPEYLDEKSSGLDSAKADLFSRSVFLLSTPSGTPGQAVDLVTAVANLAGAQVIITDFMESDGLVTTAHLLPQLISSTLVHSTMGQPGWFEARKTAGRAYFGATSAANGIDQAEALAMLAIHNKDAVVHKLNSVIQNLIELRDDIDNAQEDSLTERLQNSQNERKIWLRDRIQGEWSEDEVMSLDKTSITDRLFGGGFLSFNRANDKKGKCPATATSSNVQTGHITQAGQPTRSEGSSSITKASARDTQRPADP